MKTFLLVLVGLGVIFPDMDEETSGVCSALTFFVKYREWRMPAIAIFVAQEERRSRLSHLEALFPCGLGVRCRVSLFPLPTLLVIVLEPLEREALDVHCLHSLSCSSPLSFVEGTTGIALSFTRQYSS